MTPPINIDGTNENYSTVTIDGQDVTQITIDGQDVLTAIPDSGVSRYEFESDFTDSWANNDGTGVNSPSFSSTSAVGSQALELTAANNEAVNLPDYPSSLFSAGSVAVWVDSDTDGVFVNFGNDGASGEVRGLRVRDGGYDFIAWDFDVTTSNTQGSGYELITATWDSGTGEIDVYKNDANSIIDTTTTLNSPSVQDNAFGYHRGESSNYYGGLIDDPRVYDKVLTSTEVSNLFNNGSIDG